jgi:uncharacterized protein (TIGR03437 family)
VHVLHSDFTPVTTARPATRGETVTLAVRNLTNRGAQAGEPFPHDPLTPATVPVDVKIGSANARLVNSVGWPGETDIFRIDVQVPDGVLPGMVSLELAAAWIPARPVQIPVR